MKEETTDNIIVLEAQGYIQVPTITKGVTIDVFCYYSPEFTSTIYCTMMFYCPTRTQEIMMIS